MDRNVELDTQKPSCHDEPVGIVAFGPSLFWTEAVLSTLSRQSPTLQSQS